MRAEVFASYIIAYFAPFVKRISIAKTPRLENEAFFRFLTKSASTAVAAIAAVAARASAVAAHGEEDDKDEDDDPPVATEAR